MHAVRGIDLDVKMRRGRRADRPERRREDVDVAGDLRARAARRHRHVRRRRLPDAATSRASPGSGLIHVPEGRHVFPSLDVHENLQLGTTAAAGRTRGVLHRRRLRPVPAAPGPPHSATGGRCRVASSRWSRSVARSWPSRGCCCSTSRRSGLSPKFTPVRLRARSSQVSDRIPMLLVEQNTVMALRHCTRAAVMVGGRARARRRRRRARRPRSARCVVPRRGAGARRARRLDRQRGRVP